MHRIPHSNKKKWTAAVDGGGSPDQMFNKGSQTEKDTYYMIPFI